MTPRCPNFPRYAIEHRTARVTLWPQRRPPPRPLTPPQRVCRPAAPIEVKILADQNRLPHLENIAGTDSNYRKCGIRRNPAQSPRRARRASARSDAMASGRSYCSCYRRSSAAPLTFTLCKAPRHRNLSASIGLGIATGIDRRPK